MIDIEYARVASLALHDLREHGRAVIVGPQNLDRMQLLRWLPSHCVSVSTIATMADGRWSMTLEHSHAAGR